MPRQKRESRKERNLGNLTDFFKPESLLSIAKIPSLLSNDDKRLESTSKSSSNLNQWDSNSKIDNTNVANNRSSSMFDVNQKNITVAKRGKISEYAKLVMSNMETSLLPYGAQLPQCKVDVDSEEFNNHWMSIKGGGR